MNSNEQRKQLTHLRELITNKVFCTSCRYERSREGGIMKNIGGTRHRFVCAVCVDRVNRRLRSNQ